MLSMLKHGAAKAFLVFATVGLLSSCSSTTDIASSGSSANKQSFALATTQIQPVGNVFLKAQQERAAAQKKQAKKDKAAKSSQVAKAKKARAKEAVAREKKRLAAFDKLTAALNDQQKALLKGQRDAISGKVKSAEKELAKRTPKPKKRRVARGGGKGSRYHSLIAAHARANGVPIKLAHAVVRVESSYRANARGGAGEIGLMQIKLATARMMGYKGSAKALYRPENNIKYGMKYLGKAHKLAGGSTCGTILKYNAGHGAKRMNPISKRYCNRVARYI